MGADLQGQQSPIYFPIYFSILVNQYASVYFYFYIYGVGLQSQQSPNFFSYFRETSSLSCGIFLYPESVIRSGSMSVYLVSLASLGAD